MANQLRSFPKDPKLAAQILDAEHAGRVAEMGAIGRWFGSSANATVYLATGIIVLALIAIAILAVCEQSLRADAMKGVFGLIALVAGYMFGHGHRQT